jgi:putative peptide zinc metalloprotease protein
MTATIPPSAATEPTTQAALGRAEGIELLGPLHGSGYRDGAALVRRADGQVVQLGPLLYALLECADGQCDRDAVAAAVSERIGRAVTPDQVDQLAHKLAQQGLLAGTEHAAPPRRNPLLALRWKVLVTNPRVTRRITAPFAQLFRPWIMWPTLAAFGVVCWFVLIDKGVASATAEAFNSPALLLLVFAIAVISAGIHELGHAAACKYGGGTPGGMGAGLYLVWPAFYTDVTDAYRLPRRSRLRVDLAGLYFNAIVAVVTTVVWYFVRRDALLLLVALQLIQMVKQLSPVIRADGYHILADATGVPDLYAHMGPTLRRLLPWRRREPSALTGKARLVVTLWVLIVVPVLLALMVGAVLLLPRLLTSAWDSGHHIAGALPAQIAHGHVVDALASMLRLVALVLPALGSLYICVRLLRAGLRRAATWSSGRPTRRGVVMVAATLLMAVLAWAWWPAGQYQPVNAAERGTLPGLFKLMSSPRSVTTPFSLSPGRHLAIAMVPVGGATATHPVLYVVPGDHGQAAAVLGDGTAGTVFPFKLPSAPGPHGTQALAVNTTDGGVVYDVEYAILTVSDGSPVDETNSAFALASCRACTTVAVSFQLVLVIGQTDTIAPINAAGALNYKCPACMTSALAEQMVVTLKSQPSAELQSQLSAALQKLNAISLLGHNATPAAIAAQVAAVESQIESELQHSGLLTDSSGTTVQTSASPTPSHTASPGSSARASASSSAGPSASPSATASAAPTGSPSASPAPSATPTG